LRSAALLFRIRRADAVIWRDRVVADARSEQGLAPLSVIYIAVA
jgi:hypothetical protein